MTAAAQVQIRVDRAGLARFATSPTGPVMVFMTRLGNRVLNNARTRVNVDTGYLRSTGTMEVLPGDSAVRVAFRARYALAVHNGHHSYPGNPYLADALNEEVSRL